MSLSDAFLGASLSGLVGFLLVVPAIVIEWKTKRHEHDLPILVDIAPQWGRHLTHRELFFIALLVHVVLATLFGLLYVLFVKQNWLFVTHDPYSILSLLIFAVGAWIVTGSLIFPALGFGFFGRREEGHVWAEILVTMLTLGLALWLLVQWFQPAYFL